MGNKTFDDVNINMTLKEQSVRANLLSTKEDLAVQMGKLQKWYNDLRHEAFDGTSRDDLLIQTKTFTDIIATANNATAGPQYFGWVRQTSFGEPMLLRYRVKVWVPSNENYASYADVLLTIQSGQSAYNTTESVRNTSYRPVYYHYWGRLTAAGYNNANNYGNIVGIGLNDSTNPTATTLKRSCTVEILEQRNCTFTFFDTVKVYADVPGTGSTNYSITTGVFSGNGTYPDSNTYDRTYTAERPYAGANGVKQYSLCAFNKDGYLESFTTTHGTGTSKEFYTAGKFQYKPRIYWNSGSANIAANTIIATNALYPIVNYFDMRYSANVTTSVGFTANHALYLEIDFDSDGFWHPTENGFVQTLTAGHYYIFMGVPINVYQMPLDPFHTTFYYDGTKLIDLDTYRINQAVPSDVITGSGTPGSIAKFTDTSEIGDATWTPNTPTTCNISRGVLTFTAGTPASLS